MVSEAPPEARAAHARAAAHAAEGRWLEAHRALQPVRGLLHALPAALVLLAEACSRLDDRDAALAAAEEALPVFRARGDREGVLQCQNLAGIALLESGEVDAARRRLEEALALARELGSVKARAHAANNLGIIHDIREEPAASLGYYRQALADYQALGDGLGEARIHHNLGIAHRALGRDSEAGECFARAAGCALAAGDHRLFGFAVTARAELALLAGDAAGAERMARMALVRFDLHSTPYGFTEVHRLLGMVAAARGDFAAARSHLDRAAALSDRHRAPLLDAEVRMERGRVLWRLGERAAALEDLTFAARTFEALHAGGRAAKVWEGLAELRASDGEAAVAA